MRRVDFSVGRKPSLSLATNTATEKFVRSLGIDVVRPMLADGIDSNFIVESSDRVPEGPLRLVWLGRMVASKRPDIALGVVAELISRGVPAILTMIGDGPEREYLLAKARELGILSSVHFVGRIPWNQTFDFYDSSHFLLFTSMRDSSCPAVLEAAARGVPTLCLRHQGVASQVPESVAFGPRRFGSSSELQEKLADLAVAFTTDSDAYKAAVNSAISFAYTQTWAKKVALVLNSMDSVTEG
ncbi:glycosyltransferase [Arthrobacter ramosus]|uniref:D-inositol 3-phosphate glycosyltransferase n=1 Tax=Arthrobacter ramosus TaxID=1672 RepID=A0ABV5XUW1_ARTRM|nr:glycosyltransferase [Arthrobacter ramosus]